jgi:hypothetical protein
VFDSGEQNTDKSEGAGGVDVGLLVVDEEGFLGACP